MKSILAIGVVAVVTLTIAWCDEQALKSKSSPDAAEDRTGNEQYRPDMPAARRQAELLHTAIHRMLQTVHNEYYREDENLALPAAVFRTVFAEIEAEEQVGLRWLAVEGVAMNTDHTPRSSYEHAAVNALKAGQASWETLEDGIYRRAAAITLSGHCLKCHVPDRKSTDDRTAGLIISMPIKSSTEESAEVP